MMKILQNACCTSVPLKCISGLFLLFWLIPVASAHPLAPSLLQLEERGEAGQFDVLWKRSALVSSRTPVSPVLPAQCSELTSPRVQRESSALLVRWRVDCGEEGLVGAGIEVQGLAESKTEALVRIQLRDGRQISSLLRAEDSIFVVPARAQRMDVLRDYTRYGLEHILSGLDHLLFVFGLLLLSKNLRSLVETVTSFTLGHSLTLSLCALDWVRIPNNLAEVAIAGSLLILACELARGPEQPVTWMRRWPWLMAVSFGLLHGLGFASALRELGLPQEELLVALFSFNVGIELGQLAFIGVALLLLWAVNRTLDNETPMALPTGVLSNLPPRVRWVPVYGMGMLSAYWLFVRIASWLG
jgi:hydrogenase/urease accessory protein HupE